MKDEKVMKKSSLLAMTAVAAMAALGLSGCAADSTSTRACVILPDADSGTRWEPGDRPALESALKDAGYEAYIVGGAVRDLMVGLRPKDFDVATNATPAC